MPDTLIVLAECDPLYDEGLLYGKKLKKNNVKVEIKVYEGIDAWIFDNGRCNKRSKFSNSFY